MSPCMKDSTGRLWERAGAMAFSFWGWHYDEGCPARKNRRVVTFHLPKDTLSFIFSKPGDIRKGLFRSTQCTGAKETPVRTSVIVSILQCDSKLQSFRGQKQMRHFLSAGILASIMVLMNSEDMRRTHPTLW